MSKKSKKFAEGVKALMEGHKQDILCKYNDFAHHIASKPYASDFMSDPLNIAILIDNCEYHYNAFRWIEQDDEFPPLTHVLARVLEVEQMGIEMEVTFSANNGWNNDGNLMRGRRIHPDELMLRRPEKLYIYTFDGEMYVGFTSDDEPCTGQ